MIYRVMVRKYGYADVEAETEEAARRKTDEMWDGEFDWSERDWEDSEVVEKHDGTTLTCPDCGRAITVVYGRAECFTCGWSASDAELDEILE